VYDEKLYKADHKSHEASILPGAYLYKLGGLQHTGRPYLLSGGAPLDNPGFGRFHGPQQRTSYCSNNVLLAIAEVLYHIYRSTLAEIEAGTHSEPVKERTIRLRRLYAFQVKGITDLVNIDSEDVRQFTLVQISGLTPEGGV